MSTRRERGSMGRERGRPGERGKPGERGRGGRLEALGEEGSQGSGPGKDGSLVPDVDEDCFFVMLLWQLEVL